MLYPANYDSLKIRSLDYDICKYIVPLLKNKMIAVDLGCGTCRKDIKIAQNIAHMDCVDINMDMLTKAAYNITKANIANIRLCHGDNMDVPLPSHSYDLCTAFLTTWLPTEAHRLLCENGLLVVEALCCDDKIELKTAFGKDEFGWRGRNLSKSPSEGLNYLGRMIKPFFNIESMDIVTFNTTLTREGLIELLLTTPTIRGFSPKSDKHIIDELTPDNKVTITERRVIITARALKLEA